MAASHSDYEIERKLLDVRRRLNSLSGTLNERDPNQQTASGDGSYVKAQRTASISKVRPATTVYEYDTPDDEVLYRESTSQVYADGEEDTFDAFRVIQQRLREKMRNLYRTTPSYDAGDLGEEHRVPHLGAQNVDDGADYLPREGGSREYSPPPAFPTAKPKHTSAHQRCNGEDELCARSPDTCSPPRECSVETAAPTKSSHSSISVELSVQYTDSDDRDHDDVTCNAAPRHGGVVRSSGSFNTQMECTESVEGGRHVIGPRRPPRAATGQARGRSAPSQSPSPSPSPPSVALDDRQKQRASSSVRREMTNGRSTGVTRVGGKSTTTQRNMRSRSTTSGSPHGDAVQRKGRSSSSSNTPWNGRLSSAETEAEHVQCPRPLWTEATVLEAVTGAELFAIFRMRGLVTSTGDTHEDRLPETRCHNVYLTQREHEQLTMLREVLQHRRYAKRQQEACQK